MMKNKICVYTCITGEYDSVKEVIHEKGIDYYCFTNNKNLISNSWKIIYIENNNYDNIRLARKIKILGHDIINKDYDIFIWIDGSVNIISSLYEFIQKYVINDFDIIAFKHSKRNKVIEEGIQCAYYRKDDVSIIRDELNYIFDDGFKDDNGLIESTVYVKKNNKIVKETMDYWFSLVNKYSTRDQLGFNYSIYKTGARVKWVNENVFNNRWFQWENHLKCIEFNSARIYFDDFLSLTDSKYIDVKLEHFNDIYKLHFNVEADCSKIIIHLGQKPLYMFKINEIYGFDRLKLIVHDLEKIGDFYVLDNELLILTIDQTLKRGSYIDLEFSLQKITEKKLLNIFKQLHFDMEYRRNIFNNMRKDNQNKQNYIEYLENEINYLNNTNIITTIWHLLKNRLRRK